MSGPSAYGVEVYIGEPIQYESERSTLKEIERLLAADTRRSVVFANFTVASRQIDLVVVLEGLVLVIEAKARTGAVRGGANGPWQVRLASGEWQDFQNPYVQTRDAAFAFKDAMSAFCKRSVSYVSAALVFAPGIPRGSRAFQGDRTVSVIGHDGLPAWLGKRGGDAWSDDQWTAFAGHLGLKRVPSVAAACNAELAEAEDRLRRYAAMFCRTYEDSGKLVPFLVWIERGDRFVCGRHESCVRTAWRSSVPRADGVWEIAAGSVIRVGVLQARRSGVRHSGQGV